MGYSVVILSKNIENLKPCVQSILDNKIYATLPRIIVVDDGLKDHIPGLVYLMGQKPFIFARNANIGIRAAYPDDVILMNDDALLMTPDGFDELRVASNGYGLVAPVTDNVGNPNQQSYGKNLTHKIREEHRMVCFVCVYIPRFTIEKVGYLDERYTGYGMDDDDYCFSVRQAGLKLGIYDGCFVNHSTLHSSYRHGKTADFTGNLRLFIQKWGCDNWGRNREESEFAHLF